MRRLVHVWSHTGYTMPEVKEDKGNGTIAVAFARKAEDLKEVLGRTSVMLAPGYRFRIVDHVFTNFHAPKTTLMLLVSAFAADGGGKIDRNVLACPNIRSPHTPTFFHFLDLFHWQIWRRDGRGCFGRTRRP